MRRRSFLGAIAAMLLPVRLASGQDGKVRKVGVILQGGSWYAMLDGLRAGLRDLGQVEGKQLILDVHDTRGDLRAVEEAARTLEKAKVDLICTLATSVSLAAKRATVRVPIVFMTGTNPVAVKLVESIPRPGGRLTGVQFRATDLTGKRLELLREIAPNLHRVVTFYDPKNPSAIESAREARDAARNLGLELVERHVASVAELHAAAQAFKASQADAFIAVSDAMVDSHIESVIDMAIARRLPTMLYDPGAVMKGGLATYSADYVEVGRLSAKYVQRILAGTNPADLPVEGTDKLSFVVNMKTARQIGLAIPESVLARADRIIE